MQRLAELALASLIWITEVYLAGSDIPVFFFGIIGNDRDKSRCQSLI